MQETQTLLAELAVTGRLSTGNFEGGEDDIQQRAPDIADAVRQDLVNVVLSYVQHMPGFRVEDRGDPLQHVLHCRWSRCVDVYFVNVVPFNYFSWE